MALSTLGLPVGGTCGDCDILYVSLEMTRNLRDPSTVVNFNLIFDNLSPLVVSSSDRPPSRYAVADGEGFKAKIDEMTKQRSKLRSRGRDIIIMVLLPALTQCYRIHCIIIPRFG